MPCRNSPKVKGIITGPSTLAHGLHISTPMYRNKEELAIDLAAALVPEARSLEAAGGHAASKSMSRSSRPASPTSRLQNRLSR